MKLNGWQVAALEPDEKARKVAAEKLNMEIDPIENLGLLPSGYFDVITLWHVLEHVHDLSGYMKRFRAILKPGGRLIIAVPNHTSADANKYGTNWAAYDVPRHLWHFSPKAMETLFNQNQFTLERKLSMPLDAFYVSMLSEKYKGSGITGTVRAFFSGIKTYFSAKKISAFPPVIMRPTRFPLN
jgi:SAM-dependent methyltransferase